MSTQGAPGTTDAGTDKTNNDTPSEAEKLKAEVARLTGALGNRNKEFEELKTKVERSSMSETERLKAELAEASDRALEFERKVKEKDAVIAKQEKVTSLVSAGLKHPDFADAVLKRYDGKEDFDSFVGRIKEDDKFRGVFGEGVVQQQTPAAPPAPGTSGSRDRKKASVITDEDREYAIRRYGNDKTRVDSFLKRLEAERVTPTKREA
jgi:hypothetical protein